MSPRSPYNRTHNYNNCVENYAENKNSNKSETLQNDKILWPVTIFGVTTD